MFEFSPERQRNKQTNKKGRKYNAIQRDNACCLFVLLFMCSENYYYDIWYDIHN